MKKLLFVPVLLMGIFACGSGTEEKIAEETEELQPRVVHTKEYYVDMIKADTTWNAMIVQKAKDNGISYEEMLDRDAIFMLGFDSAVVDIENGIITDEEWMKTIREKAKKDSRTIDEQVRLDAEFMYHEMQKQKDTLQ